MSPVVPGVPSSFEDASPLTSFFDESWIDLAIVESVWKHGLTRATKEFLAAIDPELLTLVSKKRWLYRTAKKHHWRTPRMRKRQRAA
jgi:hypothetical protein